MSLKKRILRILAIVLLIGLFAGYFAFSTFFFPPIEGGLGKDVATLIPRDVDFFVARASLGDAFARFPRLAVQDAIEKTDAWKTWIGSQESRELLDGSGVQGGLEQVEQIQSQLPLGLTLIDVFGHDDLALAGYFRGRDLAMADWAAYGTVDFAGKFAFSMLSYPSLANLEAQGMKAVEEGEVVELSGGQLTRPVYLTRIRDVLVVTTARALADGARDLYARQGQDSFFQSALYFDHIENADREPEREELEVFVDVRKLYENLLVSGAWPDARSQDFVEALLGRYLQLNSTKLVTGVIGLEGGIAADLHGEFSSELITPLMTRTYRARGADRQQLVFDYAKLAPADSALFVCLQGNVGDLLRQVFESMEPEMRNLIEEAFRGSGGYDKLDDLVAELDGALKNRLVLVARPNDYPPDPSGPPHDATPVPAVALVAWTEKGGDERLTKLRDLVGLNPRSFGLKGRPGESGYYSNFESGYQTHEFWSEFVPGTGVVAVVNAADKFIVANSFQMLRQMLKTYFSGEVTSLAERDDFNALVQSSIAEANVLVWVNPDTTSTILRASARRWAEDNVPPIDWTSVRARFENDVLRDSFAGKRRAALSESEATRLDELVQPKLDAHQQEHWDRYLPALLAEKERQITYLEAARAMLFMLSLDPKHFDLSIRIVTPLPN